MSLPDWERERHWPLIRPFVYYLVDNFVEAQWVAGKRVVDFSAGLGDLTRHLLGLEPGHLTATVPDPDLDRPDWLPGHAGWLPGATAGRIGQLPIEAVDLFLARMVLQFPRWEGERVDPDVMLDGIWGLLAPGGRVVVTVHQFFSLGPALGPQEDHLVMLDGLLEMAQAEAGQGGEVGRAEAERIMGLVEMVRYLDLPPREGPSGETGFGLKVPMLVQSFLRRGYQIELVDHPEPFTYPLGVWDRVHSEPDAVRRLGERVFSVKRRYLTAAADPYTQPAIIWRMLEEVRRLVPIAFTPIVRVVGRKP